MSTFNQNSMDYLPTPRKTKTKTKTKTKSIPPICIGYSISKEYSNKLENVDNPQIGMCYYYDNGVQYINAKLEKITIVNNNPHSYRMRTESGVYTTSQLYTKKKITGGLKKTRKQKRRVRKSRKNRRR